MKETKSVYEAFMWRVEEIMRENGYEIVYADKWKTGELSIRAIINGDYEKIEVGNVDLTMLEEFIDEYGYAHISREVIGVYERYIVYGFHTSREGEIYRVALYEGDLYNWLEAEKEVAIDNGNV